MSGFFVFPRSYRAWSHPGSNPDDIVLLVTLHPREDVHPLPSGKTLPIYLL